MFQRNILSGYPTRPFIYRTPTTSKGRASYSFSGSPLHLPSSEASPCLLVPPLSSFSLPRMGNNNFHSLQRSIGSGVHFQQHRYFFFGSGNSDDNNDDRSDKDNDPKKEADKERDEKNDDNQNEKGENDPANSDDSESPPTASSSSSKRKRSARAVASSSSSGNVLLPASRLGFGDQAPRYPHLMALPVIRGPVFPGVLTPITITDQVGGKFLLFCAVVGIDNNLVRLDLKWANENDEDRYHE